jgi:3-oxoacyl-[acyl-carrier protein] reductase
MGALDGRIALVTGGGRGIGAAIVKRFAAEGATVLVNDVDQDPIDDTVAAVGAAGGMALPAPGDVTTTDGTSAIVGVAAREFGRLDILVNNAGITRDAMLHKMTDEQWDFVVDVSLRGTFHLCREAFPLMRGDKDQPPHHRKVINMASINGIYGVAANTNYSAAKAGVIGLTKALAREWGRYRINVNAIAPGYIAGTRLTAVREEGGTIGMPPEVVERIVKQVPIGRGGTPDDIAGVARFLASSDSDFVTGQVIEAHGGLEIIQLV